jgi:hypothetical protein
MKKKLILIVTLLFFLSTTGLPISLHYCQMQSSTSFSSCEMCSLKEIELEPSCCEEEFDSSVQIKAENSEQCCATQIIDKSISDNFIPLKLEVKQDPSSSVIYLTNLISKQLILNHQFINSAASPPFTQHNDLYLQNSVLLI